MTEESSGTLKELQALDLHLAVPLPSRHLVLHQLSRYPSAVSCCRVSSSVTNCFLRLRQPPVSSIPYPLARSVSGRFLGGFFLDLGLGLGSGSLSSAMPCLSVFGHWGFFACMTISAAITRRLNRAHDSAESSYSRSVPAVLGSVGSTGEMKLFARFPCGGEK